MATVKMIGVLNQLPTAALLAAITYQLARVRLKWQAMLIGRIAVTVAVTTTLTLVKKLLSKRRILLTATPVVSRKAATTTTTIL